MKKFSNYCGIFATLFVTTTIILLASCSQDDDYYDSDMYTLAEMGTRLGGDGGDPGGSENSSKKYKTNKTIEIIDIPGKYHGTYVPIYITYTANQSLDSLISCKITWADDDLNFGDSEQILHQESTSTAFSCSIKAIPHKEGIAGTPIYFDSGELLKSKFK